MLGRGVVLACCFTVPLAHGAAVALADDNDLVLGRLTNRMDDGTGTTRIVPQNAEFRSLASQLGVVLAPHLLTPADTLGFGGFQLTLDYATTTIDGDASYWRAREAESDPGGTVGHAPGMLRTLGFFARKGMWFPIPSFEVGAGAVHLVDSRIWTGQFYAKLALVEGYHDLPLPSVAVRGAVSRMMSQRELDLTVPSFDITISKHFGIGGTWRLDPYAGWNLLMIIPRSEVIDPTPHIDPLAPGNEDDSTQSFVFKDQDLILRHRFIVGAKFQYYILQLTVEASFALAGTSKDDRSGTSDVCMPQSTTTTCDAADTAAAQRTLSVSAGVDF
ncbi:MAG: hypothetical protein H0T89_01775 [Deltaproteobacteria bacterium]|nr:hypothetical protein [Deltaproteobacteria bacterium]MDQ3296974.1 hypothetical protein [Myxococcota bacterium]